MKVSSMSLIHGSIFAVLEYSSIKVRTSFGTGLGLTTKVEDHVNRIPRSQRGGEVIEPLVSSQWFLKMDGMAKDALHVMNKKYTMWCEENC